MRAAIVGGGVIGAGLPRPEEAGRHVGAER